MEIHRDQLLTVGDLDKFRMDLLREITVLLEEKGNAMPKQWLRMAEVREMLGISPGTLQNLRVSGKLSFSKVGSIVFYKYEDVIALLEKNYVPKVD